MIPLLFKPTKRLWTPRDLPSLQLWFEAADLSTIILNGSTVSQWNGKAGNNRNISQTLASSQPGFSLTSFNSKPGVTFDGVNDVLVSSFSETFAPVNYALTLTTSNNNLSITMFGGSGDFIFSSRSAGYQFGSAPQQIAPATISDLNIVVSSANLGSKLAWVNGIAASLNTGSSFGGTGVFQIGARNAPSSPSDFWGGTISKLIVFSGEINTIDRLKLEGYLAHKDNLLGNLPANHPYKYAPPLK